MPEIFTVGHSNHLIEKFIELLELHSITAVADVRSSPFSRFVPHFNQDNLKNALALYRIKYVFLGKELGARPPDPHCYVNGQVSFKRLAGTHSFRSGIERLLQGTETHRIALMCAEKDPLDCHRTILVARNLSKEDVSVQHIIADGSLETQLDAMERLVKSAKLTENDLFLSHEEVLDMACTIKETAIAYTEHEAEAGGAGHADDVDREKSTS